MASSEFVELSIDNTPAPPKSDVFPTSSSNDDDNKNGGRFLSPQTASTSTTSKMSLITNKCVLVSSSVVCFVVTIIIIIAVATRAETEHTKPRVITQQCLSPNDPAIDEATLYHLQGFWYPTEYVVFTGLNSKLEGNTSMGVDIKLEAAAAAAADGEICEWVWMNTDKARILNLQASVHIDGPSHHLSVSPANVVHHPTIDVVGIHLPKEILEQLRTGGSTKNNVILHFAYHLDLNNQALDGLYVSKWQDKEGDSHNIVASQMEATSARRAFPCVDQPSDKAVFWMVVGCVDCNKLTVLSNMPVAASDALPSWSGQMNIQLGWWKENNKNNRIVHFEPSPTMSTYLLALTVGELEYSETSLTASASTDDSATSATTKVRIYTTKGSKSLGAYALSAAKIVLEQYQKQFGIDFPLPKCDMVAIPDFAAGAMENWGLVLYRETALLVDPALSSDADKQRVAVVVAHELAHQWFGNLVTMQWWNDLWLNEGFATYTEYQGTNAVDPSLDVWRQFLRSVTQPALALDGTRIGTHKLHQKMEKVATPGAIEELFDTIDYEKGGAVVRMIATALDRGGGAAMGGGENGQSPWNRAIAQYLSAHKYGNAESSDLWKSVAAQSKTLTVEMLSTWSHQVGFPLVTVGESVEVDGPVSLSQSRFYNNEDPVAGGDPTKWWIPLTYVIYKKDDNARRNLPVQSPCSASCKGTTSDGTAFDLSALMGQDYQTVGSDQNDDTYFLNVCGTSATKCPDDAGDPPVTQGMAVQTVKAGGCYVLGQYTGDNCLWTATANPDGQKGIQLVLDNGSNNLCGDGSPRQVTIAFVCPTAGSDGPLTPNSWTAVNLPGSCEYTYTFETCAACTGGCGGEPPEPTPPEPGPTPSGKMVDVSAKRHGGECRMDSDETTTCSIEVDEKTECFKLNLNTDVFIRVQYSKNQWQCLLSTFHRLPTDDRSGLIDDVFFIARSKQDNGVLSTDYNIPLSFAKSSSTSEKDLGVWSPILYHLNWILNKLESSSPEECQTLSNNFFLAVVGPMADVLGIVPKKEDDHLTRLLRVRLVGAAAARGHQGTIDAARALYQDQSKVSSLSPDEKSIVYKTVVRWGGKTEFDAVLSLYSAATFAPEKTRYMYALASTQDSDSMNRLLEMSLMSKDVRSQDTVSLLGAITRSSSMGRERTFAFVKKHWTVLMERYGSGGFALTRLVNMWSGFSTKKGLDDVQAWFQEHPVPAAEREVEGLKEEIESAVAWSKRSTTSVCTWLSTHNGR